MPELDELIASLRERVRTRSTSENKTEDKVYQIGEISQKTGLQKTANGWVKPKSGKQPGAKEQNAPAGSKKIDYQVTEKGGKFYATGHQFSDGSQLHAGPFGSEKELHEFMNGSPYKSTAESKPAAKKEEPKNVHGAEVDKIYERQLKRIKELKAKGFTDEQIEKMYAKTQQTPEQQKADFDKSKIGQAVNKGRQEFAAEKARQKELASKTNAIGLPKESKPAGTRHAEKRKTNRPKAIRWDRNNLNEMRGNEEYINAKAADNYYHQYGLDKIGEWTDSKGWTVKEYQNDDGETYRAKYNGEKYVGSEYDPTGEILSPENKDAAPRVLTGDTRIRVRKA